jgi:diguanylate cyclase (GGDEF)-like protein
MRMSSGSAGPSASETRRVLIRDKSASRLPVQDEPRRRALETLRGSHFVSRLWRVVAALLLLLSLLIAQSIYTSRRQHEEQAVVETYSVARVLESDIANLVDKVKLALHTLGTAQERSLAGSGPDEPTMRRAIANIHGNLSDVVGIRVADAAGRLVYQTEFANAPAPDVGAMPWFRRLRDDHVSGVVLSAPHRDGPDGPHVIDIARRVEHPDGSFAGAVVAPVPVERLVSMLAAADVGPGGAVALRGENLELIARHPPLADPARGDAVPPAIRGFVERGEISGTFHAVSAADGVERLCSYRRVAAWPLHITVGRATDEYLGHWRRDMGIVALLASMLFAVSIGATIMVDRAWRRQRRIAHLLEAQAQTDPLTGLANRRHFMEVADAELARSRRYETPLSMLMIDIDHFKEVNDAHGHRAGDRVLQQLARTCREVLREVDVAGRVGGEEFAILLPETEAEDAYEVAERLRIAVEATEIAREEGVPIRVTVSIGVAAIDGSTNLDTLMSQADDALYDAKHGGRNLVRRFGERR